MFLSLIVSVYNLHTWSVIQLGLTGFDLKRTVASYDQNVLDLYNLLVNHLCDL